MKIVIAVDQAPVVAAPATVLGPEGVLITFTVTASDPNSGQTIASLAAAPLPLGATFTANAAKTSATFSWIPTFNQAGTYAVTFTAANALSSSATMSITVTDQNRPPTADAGGPYSGTAGVSVVFDASASSDPDGDVLSYEWDYGDGVTGAGVAPGHVYAAGGVYEVSLTVTDDGSPALSGTATTTATIAASLAARAFTTGGNKAIRLTSGKPRWCVQVEPQGGSFTVGDADLATLGLKYQGVLILAEAGKASVSGDQDGNGVVEITACFSKESLRTLFAGLPSGRNAVTVAVEASLSSGAKISGEVTVDVFGSGGFLVATVSPNPLNPEAVLSFVTRKPGVLRVRLYDVKGRLVRTLAEETSAAAGHYDLRIDGRGDHGERLASGTYFFRIVGADGASGGRITIMK